jgi:hypothetical protein
MKLRLSLGSLLLLAATLLAGCAQDNATTPAASDDPHAIGHVHGLGVDPSDGVLYVAGHNGVFRVEDGVPTRVADRWQDTMAFTVAGPRTFLASGHPDPREGLPPHLGLIESTDAGQSWTALSLQGEADFHALAISGGRVYGYDSTSGRLMSTTDRKSWRTIATGQYVDLAALPAREDRVLATTPAGEVHEVPLQGEARAVAGTPPLLLLDSSPAGQLVGLSGAGEVYTSDGAAGPWKEVGRVAGTPAALSATEAAWFVATHDAIYESGDRGSTWTPVLR